MNPVRQVLVWCVILASAVLAGLWTQDIVRSGALIARWQQQLLASYGVEATVHITAAAIQRARAIEQSALQAWRWPDHSATDAARAVHAPGGPLTLLTLKATTAIAWWPVLVPLWLAAAVQGATWRDVRRHRFAGSDPRLHGACTSMAIATAGVAACALVLPVDLPLSIIPASGVAFAALIAGAIAHYPTWHG
jgi:hypothetical protein